MSEITRNQCAACDHRKHRDGGWCYMFRVEPDGVCAKHTALGIASSASSHLRTLLEASPRYVPLATLVERFNTGGTPDEVSGQMPTALPPQR